MKTSVVTKVVIKEVNVTLSIDEFNYVAACVAGATRAQTREFLSKHGLRDFVEETELDETMYNEFTKEVYRLRDAEVLNQL